MGQQLIWAGATSGSTDPLVLVLVLLATSLCAVYGVILRSRSRGQYPPGPRGFPIVGNLHMLGTHPHRTLAHLSKTYGPLFSLRFGSVPAIVASSPAMAKLFLQSHDKIFSGRPLFISLPRILVGGRDDMASSQPNAYWKLMRQLCATELMSAQRLNSSQPLRAQETRDLLLSVFAAQGTPLCIRRNLHRANMNLVTRLMVGKNLAEIAAETPDEESIEEILREILSLVGKFNIGDYIPALGWLDVQGYRRKSKKVARRAGRVFEQLIARRRRSRAGCSSDEPPGDFLDVLLSAAADDKNAHLQIDDSHIMANIIDIIMAGVHTTATTTEWAFIDLLLNPQKLQTLREELNQVVGSSRLVHDTDLPNLPYLRAVANESLRMHSVGPLLLPHMAMESPASDISGYHIPKSTVVYVNASAIHADPHIWDNPSQFSPERFLGGNTEALTQQCKFLPFGSGRRICPGKSLALLSVQAVLANLVHAFDWETPAKPSLKENFGIVVGPEEPLVAVPRPRVPKSLLETFA